MDVIGGFKLTNKGGFVCAGKVQYIDSGGYPKLTDRWHWIGQDSEVMVDLGQKGVPEGSIIQLYIEIRAGDNRTGGRYFRWDPSSRSIAEYRITGTTLNSAVHFEGIRVGVLQVAAMLGRQ
jgi:hypothetical protein